MSRRVGPVEPLLPLDERYLRSRLVARSMHNMAVCVIDGAGLRTPDGAPDLAAVRRAVATRAHRVARYRQRLMPAPLGLTTPAWVDDDAFDVDRHVVLWPEVLGGPEGLDAFASALQRRPLDLTRPGWEIVVGDLADGDLVVVVRAHHVLGDGVFGLVLLQAYFDEEPGDVDLPAPPYAPRAPRHGVELLLEMGRQWWAQQDGPAAAWRDYRRKNFVQRLRRTAGRSIRGPRDAWLERRDPAAVRPVERCVRLVDVDLTAVKRRARDLGGSVNDLLVSAAARGVSALAAERGEPVEGRVEHLLVPISGRTGGDASAGNMVRAATVAVPLDEPVESVLPLVHDRIRAALRPGSGAPERPVWAASVSMLPGPRRTSYFARQRLRSLYFVPGVDPRDRLTLFAITYGGRLQVAVVAHAELGPALGALVGALTAELAPEGAPAAAAPTATPTAPAPAAPAVDGGTGR